MDDNGRTHSERIECAECNGTRFRWRVPDGFNPFMAGGWNTVRAMYQVPCGRCPSSPANDNGE